MDGWFWSDVKAGRLPGVKSRRSTAVATDPRTVTWPTSDWRHPTTFPNLGAHDVVGIDLETVDPHLQTHGPGWGPYTSTRDERWGHVLGVALDWGAGRTYFDLRHPVDHPDHSRTLEPPHVVAWLRDMLRTPGIQWVAHNALYDAGWLATLVGTNAIPWERWHDTLIAAVLEYDHHPAYNLDACAQRAGLPGKDTALLEDAAAATGWRGKEVRAVLGHLPARFVAPYAEHDAHLTRALWLEGGDGVAPYGSAMAGELHQVYQVEQQLVPVLHAMRCRGVPVDTALVAELGAQWSQDEAEAQAALAEAAGRPVDVWAANDLAQVCDAHGIAYPRTAKTNAPSFVQEWLDQHEHPLFGHVRTVRSISKMRGTFLDGYFTKLPVAGRLHAEFRAVKTEEGGAISGRLSSAKPNLQNIPVRDQTYGPPLRRCLVAHTEPGWAWVAADYAQQEPRLTVHFASLAGAPGAADTVAAYHRNPRTDMHAWVAELMGQPRGRAKTINLGLIYGKGGGLLCHELGLPTVMKNTRYGKREMAGPEGQALLDQYHAAVPWAKHLSEQCERTAKRREVIRTLLGRHCRFPGGEFAHKALNRLIQGSAADMTKLAMIATHRACEADGQGAHLLVTVHDELGVAKPPGHQGLERLVQEAMESAVELLVPVLADVGTGPSWGHAKT